MTDNSRAAAPLRIAVVGATGVLGRHLVPRLVERGHTVRAGLRGPARAAELRAAGADVVSADIFDADSLTALFKDCAVAVHAATAVPRPVPHPRAAPDFTLNDRIRREGTRLLLHAARRAGVRCIAAQSIALLHAGAGAEWITELSILRPGPISQSAADMETLLRNSALDFRILRGGAFYGPGTGRDEAWRIAARDGTLRLPGEGEDFISLIHVVDMARAMVAAIEADQPRSTFLVTDDEPVKYRELLGFVAEREGAAQPARGGPPFLGSLRASNARLRELGWQPCYPTYRSGWV